MRSGVRSGVPAILSVVAGAAVLGFSLGGMSGVDRRLQASTPAPPVVTTQVTAAQVPVADGPHAGHHGTRARDGAGGHGRRAL